MATQKRKASPVTWVLLLVLIAVLIVGVIYLRNQTAQGEQYARDMIATQRVNVATSVALTNAP